MIMYLETFKIIYYHLILNALHEQRLSESFCLIFKYGSSVYTGSILRRQIEAHGYNTRDLAMLIGSTKELLDGIVAEQEALTMDIAQGLEMVLGVSAAMWMNLQKAYDQAMSV